MGPLQGVRVIEVASIGPGPFTAMLLADMGAEVVRIDRIDRIAPRGTARAATSPDPALDVLNRGRRSLAVDLKHPRGVETVLRLVSQAEVFLEGFRPGVMERLGLAPDVCLARNPRLVYGRMTGWGQEGPLAQAPGHDINFIALAGALRGIARAGERPVPPLNLVGDFGGGGLLQAFGIVCALLEARRTGAGQVVDTAMVDGAALLMTMVCALAASGEWRDPPGTNLLDSGAHFYDTYETADGRYVAVGAIEPRFYAELLRRLGIEGDDLPDQLDRSQWPAMKDRFARVFRTRTRAEWCQLLEGSDACVSPVLSLEEAAVHPHNRARATFQGPSGPSERGMQGPSGPSERGMQGPSGPSERGMQGPSGPSERGMQGPSGPSERRIQPPGGVLQPAPAPRFSRTPPHAAPPPPLPGQHTDDVLAAWSHSPDEVAELRRLGAVA